MKKICLPQTVHWRIFIFSAILALTGLFCTPQLDAEMYGWVDENGVKHYSNTFPANAGNVKIVSREYEYPHDEAVDQKRVKADQKAIDALTEEIKDKSDSCLPLSKQIIQMAEDFDLEGIQKLADALDVC